MRYKVQVYVEGYEIYEVEADSKEEAIELVAEGDGEMQDFVSKNSEYPEVVEVMKG